jgi:sarcosine oxidase subunit alpha
MEPARQGQVVKHQNAWPSLDLDVLRVFDKLDQYLPVGFYYKQFYKPRWVWPLFEHIVRHIAGLGEIDPYHAPEVESEVEYLHTEVCVVGGGPAGMSAAMAAASAGAQVLLAEREPRLGGHLLYEMASEAAPDLQAELHRLASVCVLCNTSVFGLYEGNLLGAFQGSRLLKIRASQIIICTGGRQQPFLFHNNDLPGIFLCRGVLRLARLHGVKAGSRAVVLTDNDSGHRLAEQLKELGIAVPAIVDCRTTPVPPPKAGKWPVQTACAVVRAEGTSHLRAVHIARLYDDGSVDASSCSRIPCDLLCLASELTPANELLHQGGMRPRFDGEHWVSEQVPGLAAAGAAAGTVSLTAQLEEGRSAGAQAAAALGYVVGFESETHGRSTPASEPRSCSRLLPQAAAEDRKRFVCLCEDVTEKDVRQAIAEGFDGIETLKRYSTVNMGPCQGKMCGPTAVELCALATGRQVREVGTTTSRPPVVPVELAVLAAPQQHHPLRRTPLHHWHEKAGARWLDAGQWKRPESYGEPVAEVRAVRTAVGLIDVSTLGKFELMGPDVVELLERIYLNRGADLKIGRIRYGALCNEDGILLDDGVVARLGPDRFYLTATTGNADGVFQWLELWKATWRLNVTVLNQTSGMAAMNLAGPCARTILSRLTTLDVSREAFPYLAFREGTVAGVPCRLLRIGFVGELGYEIHCPTKYARHLWETLCTAGKDFGLRPFGVEAQRILRLEKGHLIIGQDTDALSNPLEAGLEGMVRFDKPSFIGREPLARLQTLGMRSRLVGFELTESSRPVQEGCQVMADGKPVGRVTSSRFSPTLERSLGLAWLPAGKAQPGQRFFIRCNGIDVPALVVSTPFYDPSGARPRD